METGLIVGLAILGFFGSCFAVILGAAFRSLFDHSKWSKNSDPRLDARIVDVKTDIVQYVKNGAKYKTTVRFSDGFIFTTHETNREDDFFSYRISISADLSKQIIANAVAAHEKAVLNRLSKHRIKKATPMPQTSPKNIGDPFAVYHQKPQCPEHQQKQKQKKTLPSGLSWLLRPYHIVAIIGLVASIAINICIPEENVFYLFSALGLMFIEYSLMAVINAIWGIPGKVLALLPYFIAIVLGIIVSIVFQSNAAFDGYDFIARISPFAATISVTMWVKYLWEQF